MKLNYNITGAERKSLVGAISQELNAPTKYLGAPTFDYEVGDYHIDRNGTLTGKDDLDLEDALHRMEFDASERKYDEPDTYESGLGGMGATPSIEALNDEAEREMRRLDIESQHVPDYTIRGQYGTDADVPETDPADRLTVELPIDGFTPEPLENLKKIVSAKETLIKKALGAEDIPIQVTEDTIKFPWFYLSSDPTAVRAYTHLVTALCEMSKTQKRVTATDKPVENEKYAFRCFLLRLGFIGAEYQAERKILLSKLSGSSAFKNQTSGGADDE